MQLNKYLLNYPYNNFSIILQKLLARLAGIYLVISASESTIHLPRMQMPKVRDAREEFFGLKIILEYGYRYKWHFFAFRWHQVLLKG